MVSRKHFELDSAMLKEELHWSSVFTSSEALDDVSKVSITAKEKGFVKK